MSFDSQLIHTCTIENAVSGAVDAHNNATPLWDAPITDVRCRLIESRERVLSDERQESAIVTTYKLLVNASVDLQDRARVTKVTVDGVEIADVFTVTEVLLRNGRNSRHKMAMLERFS